MMHHRGITAGEIAPPAWYFFAAYRQAWAVNWFEAHGVEAFYPQTTKMETRHKQGRRHRVEVTRPAVSGFVFAAFRGQPLWHVIRERASPKIGRVLTVGGEPRRFTDAEMMQMSNLPHRLEALRREAEERARIHPGDTIRHPTFGACKVHGVDGRVARILAPLFGDLREVEADMTALEKIG